MSQNQLYDYEDGYEDEQPRRQPIAQQAPAKKAKRVMTPAQKESALINLEKARLARGKNKQPVKERERTKKRRDYSDSETESSDEEDFVLSKKKPKSSKRSGGSSRDKIQGDVNDLKALMAQMVEIQRKQKRRNKDYDRAPATQQAPSANVNAPAPTPIKKAVTDPYLDKLKKSIMGF